MPEAELKPEPSFKVQKQGPDSSRQPLKIYHLSHDLRGPLNSILGFAELLLEGIEGPINEVQSEDLAAIHQSAQNLLRLINTVVDLSKLEDDRLLLSFEPVQLDTVIEDVLTSEPGTNNSNLVDLVANVPKSLPPLWGDHDRVGQMVRNLVSFALKIQPDGQININVEQDDKDAIIQIIVANVWLPPEQLEELFELVVKIDAAGRGELGAGGLDLPLTRQLAEKHRGRVWVENQEELGATFFLRLPLCQPA